MWKRYFTKFICIFSKNHHSGLKIGEIVAYTIPIPIFTKNLLFYKKLWLTGRKKGDVKYRQPQNFVLREINKRAILCYFSVNTTTEGLKTRHLTEFLTRFCGLLFVF